MSDKFKPTVVADILLWDYTVFPSGHFDVVWASPPCTEYSRAKTVGFRDLVAADALVIKVLEIIDYVKPLYWWIENPATGLLHTRPCVQHLPEPYRVDYCQYGAPYRKATHLWPNCLHLRPRLCTGRCFFYRGKRHVASAQRVANKGDIFKSFDVATLYKITRPLCDDIAFASSIT